MLEMQLLYLNKEYEKMLLHGDSITSNLLQVKLKQVPGYHLMRALSLNELLHDGGAVQYL